MPLVRPAAALAIVAALVGSGCTTVRRCPIPPPVAEAAPGPRLPVSVEVRYALPAVPAESREEARLSIFSGPTVTIVDSAPATRALFDRLAASMLERPAAAPADLVLELRLERFQVGFVRFGPFTSEVGYHATVRTPDGAEVASFDVAGVASVAPSFRHLGACGARGEAAAVAMQGAGAELLRKVSESQALAAWLAGRGVAPVAFRVKRGDEYVDPAASTATATATATASPTPRPVDPGPPPAPVPPRSFRIRGGVASYRPQSTAGKLENPSRSLDWTVFAGEARIAPGLRLDVDVDWDGGRDFDATSVPHLTGFGPRATLTGLTTGVGLKLSPPLLPGLPLEPWVGASARLFYTKLQVTYFGGLGGGETIDSAWTVGADLGGGINLFVGALMLGFDVRWRVGRASLGPLGSVDVGGLLVGGSVGVALPP